MFLFIFPPFLPMAKYRVCICLLTSLSCLTWKALFLLSWSLKNVFFCCPLSKCGAKMDCYVLGCDMIFFSHFGSRGGTVISCLLNVTLMSGEFVHKGTRDFSSILQPIQLPQETLSVVFPLWPEWKPEHFWGQFRSQVFPKICNSFPPRLSSARSASVRLGTTKMDVLSGA